MSDEGGFWRARHPPNCTAARAIKPTEVGGVAAWQDSDKAIENTGEVAISTPPHVGKGVGIPKTKVRILSRAPEINTLHRRKFEHYSGSTTTHFRTFSKELLEKCGPRSGASRFQIWHPPRRRARMFESDSQFQIHVRDRSERGAGDVCGVFRQHAAGVTGRGLFPRLFSLVQFGG